MSPYELLQRTWISIHDRLPPDSTDMIVVYIPGYRRIDVRHSQIARIDAKRTIKEGVEYAKKAAWDRVISHWMAIPPPVTKERRRRRRR